jgi:DNA/RNA endonuclease G (NUC1)
MHLTSRCWYFIQTFILWVDTDNWYNLSVLNHPTMRSDKAFPSQRRGDEWKVIVALQPGKTYPAVAGSTTIAVLMPNSNGIRSYTWQQYQTTVTTIASRTGYNISNYPQ